MSALVEHLEAALRGAREQESYIADLHEQLHELRGHVRTIGPTLVSFPERLDFALTRWGGSNRAFTKEMEKTGVRGASYRALSDYRNGDYRPKRIWIEKAAQILGIDFAWLAGE